VADDAAPDEVAAPAKNPADIRKLLPWAGLFIAFWATLPKYSGPKLTIKGGATTEFVDHIVPGVVVGLMCLLVLAVSKRAQGPGLVPFTAAAVTLFAGLWMVATHWQLIRQATQDQAPWAGAIYHTSAALAVFGFGMLWSVVQWPDLSAAMAEDDRKRAATPASSED
jgi:hypothetical protein